MARQTPSIVGSGTSQQTAHILNPVRGGDLPAAEGIGNGVWGGTNVTLTNPEDINSVFRFAASGVTVGSTATEIWGPGINYVLPTIQRKIVLFNDGGEDVFIGHNAEVITVGSGIRISSNKAHHTQSLELPFMHNVSIYAKTLSGNTEVRILAY